MLIYHYRSKVEVPLSEPFTLENLQSTIASSLHIPENEIVVCSIDNKFLTSETEQKISSDMKVIVYDTGKVIMDGLNKEGLCLNKECKLYNKRVIENCGFTSCERVFVGCTGVCPSCTNPMEVLKIYLKNCHYSIIVLSNGKEPIRSTEIDAIDILPEDYDVDFDPTVEYDFKVQNIDCYVCNECHQIIKDDHQCERVHRHSLCRKCSASMYYCL